MSVDKKKLTALLSELEKTQAEYKGKNMPEDVGAEFDRKAAEAKAMQDEADAEKQSQAREQAVKGLRRFANEIPEPMLPAPESTKENGKVAGYITPGDFAVLSEAYVSFLNRGARKNAMAMVDMKNLLPIKGQKLMALSEEQCKAIGEVRSQFETKDLPVLGTGVIAPDRVDRFVQDTMPDRLTLRDLLNVSATSSPVIQYIAEVSYTEGAAIQSEGPTAALQTVKGESDVEYEQREATVKTLATTIPVSEQMLADAPALVNRINTRLLWDVQKLEEQQCGYGDGTGLNFTGFFDTGTGIADADTRAVVGDSLLDTVRRGITDVMTAGYEPNGLWIHPVDWEEIELAKGSDGQYVWAIVRDVLGPRIWGLRVVQGVGTLKSGDTTRNLLIGDFARGATLYDRQQSSIAIGWIDDQFARNLRTIRAEERCVLVVEAPKAFSKLETAS